MTEPREVVRRDEASPESISREAAPKESLRHRLAGALRQVESTTWAAGASVLALASVLVPGLLSQHATYSPTLAILTITAVAVVWYTAFSYELVSAMWKDREERRAEREEQETERRRRLEILLMWVARVLGGLVPAADEQEILSRIGWFEEIEHMLYGFVGLDEGEYDIELMLAANALLELRIQTDSTLRSGRVPNVSVGGEPDKLSRLLDEAQESLVNLYARLTGQSAEEVAPGIPR